MKSLLPWSARSRAPEPSPTVPGACIGLAGASIFSGKSVRNALIREMAPASCALGLTRLKLAQVARYGGA